MSILLIPASTQEYRPHQGINNSGGAVKNFLVFKAHALKGDGARDSST